MRVTLLHNPSAGDEDHNAAGLCTLIEAAGHDVRYVSLDDDADWKHAVDDETDLVAIAGGDGSVGTILLELSTTELTATILPLGSANNIATALRVAGVELERLVGGWARGEPRHLFLGGLVTSEGSSRFVESAGGGLFAESLARAEEQGEVEDKVELGLRLLRELVDELPARRWRVEADGADCSGVFLAVEAMVIGRTGPNVPLAPTADPSDDRLALVQITDEHRTALASYLDERVRGGRADLPALTARRAREVKVWPPAQAPLRLDSAIHEAGSWTQDGGPAALTGAAASVRFLQPDCE